MVQSNHSLIISTIDKYTKDYLETIYQTGKSEQTIRKYTNILNQFRSFNIDYIKNSGLKLTIEDINQIYIKEYIKYLENTKKSINTQNQHLITIKSFLYYICDIEGKLEHIRTNISKFKIKVHQNKISSFTMDEREKILILADKLSLSKKYTEIRDAAILKVLLYTGIRANELLQMKWVDISEINGDYHGKEIQESILKFKIKAKGGEVEHVYILESLISEELTYLKSKTNSPFVFVSHTSQLPLDRRVVFGMIQNRLKKIFIYDASIHKMRHTFANYLKSIGENLETIQRLCRHKNIAITAKYYLDTSEEDKINVAKRIGDYKLTIQRKQ